MAKQDNAMERFTLELEYIRTALELIEEGKSLVYRIADGADVTKLTAEVRTHRALLDEAGLGDDDPLFLSDGRSERYSIAKCLTYVEQILSAVPVRKES